jgi:hypothetical protein
LKDRFGPVSATTAVTVMRRQMATVSVAETLQTIELNFDVPGDGKANGFADIRWHITKNQKPQISHHESA